MSSDVVLYSTVALVGTAAAATAGYFALRGGGDGGDEVADKPNCTYDTTTDRVFCNCDTGNMELLRKGAASNSPQCPAFETISMSVKCDDASRVEAGCPTDCETSEWGEFSACDCAAGTKTRTRTIVKQANATGKPCGPLVDTVDCASSCVAAVPDGAPDCSKDPKCTATNPCSPVETAAGWECKFRCDQNRTVACEPLYQEEVCTVPNGQFGQFSCDSVCDISLRPGCLKSACCKLAGGCAVKVEAANGLSEAKIVARGDWYCQDPCANQLAPTCTGSDEAACVLTTTGHRLQCVSKCRTLPRPTVDFAEDLTCKIDTGGVASWEKASMCANKPIPVCGDQSRTAGSPQCVLTDAARARPAGTAYSPADFEWKCISPCGLEPPCAAVAGITPMVCAQDTVNGTFQWTGTCIRNTDVEKCGPYLCSSNETAYCTTSREWTECVDASCRANPDPNYACPAAGADPLIDYKELCDPVTSVVTCKPQCKATPPPSLICDPKTQYPHCSDATGFRYECRNYGDTMCSAAKPDGNFRCVPGDSGWNWVSDNVYMANRWQYVDYIQRQAVFAPYRYEAVNADNPSGPKITVLCQDVGCTAPISPTIGVDCIGSAKVAKALEGALGNPIGNLAKTNSASAQVDGNLTFYPRDVTKRQYYRPNRDNFDLVCPLIGALLPSCSGNGSFDQDIDYDPLELSSAARPYSGSLTGSCVCRTGWQGPSCQFSDVTTCGAKGTVDATGKCTCYAGFAGAGCQFSDAVTCNGKGTVDATGKCTCQNGYYGAACTNKDATYTGAIVCTNPCRLPGTVNTAEFAQPYCTVAPIGAGKTCQQVASDACASSTDCVFNNGPGWYIFVFKPFWEAPFTNASILYPCLSDFNNKVAVTKGFYGTDLDRPKTIFRLEADGTLVARDYVSTSTSSSWPYVQTYNYGPERRLNVRVVFNAKRIAFFLFADGTYYKPTTSITYLVNGNPFVENGGAWWMKEQW